MLVTPSEAIAQEQYSEIVKFLIIVELFFISVVSMVTLGEYTLGRIGISQNQGRIY